MKIKYLFFCLLIANSGLGQSFEIDSLSNSVEISIKTTNSHTIANCEIKNKTGQPLNLILRKGQVFQLKDTSLTNFQTMILCNIEHEKYNEITYYHQYWTIKLEKDKTVTFNIELACITRNARPPRNQELVAVGFNYGNKDNIQGLCEQNRDGIHNDVDKKLQTLFENKKSSGVSTNRIPTEAKKEAFEKALLNLLQKICPDINRVTQINEKWYREETPYYGAAEVELSWSRNITTSNSIKVTIIDCNAKQKDSGEWEVTFSANVTFTDRAVKEFENCLLTTNSVINE